MIPAASARQLAATVVVVLRRRLGWSVRQVVFLVGRGGGLGRGPGMLVQLDAGRLTEPLPKRAHIVEVPCGQVHAVDVGCVGGVRFGRLDVGGRYLGHVRDGGVLPDVGDRSVLVHGEHAPVGDRDRAAVGLRLECRPAPSPTTASRGSAGAACARAYGRPQGAADVGSSLPRCGSFSPVPLE